MITKNWKSEDEGPGLSAAGTPRAGERGREERGGFTVPDTVPTLVPQDNVGCGGSLWGQERGCDMEGCAVLCLAHGERSVNAPALSFSCRKHSCGLAQTGHHLRLLCWGAFWQVSGWFWCSARERRQVACVPCPRQGPCFLVLECSAGRSCKE